MKSTYNTKISNKDFIKRLKTLKLLTPLTNESHKYLSNLLLEAKREKEKKFEE